ncbi:MAG: FAD-dependent oxidoreductase, partial [Gammaproteobacteria bacterium]
SSQAEGAERDWSVMTTRLTGKNGKLKKLHCVRVDDDMKPVEGSDFALQVELVLLAMGFVHPVHEGMIEALKVELDSHGNVLADEISYQTSREKVYAAGDMRRGQSLVVWAIREGRQAAHAIDAFLMGWSDLPR